MTLISSLDGRAMLTANHFLLKAAGALLYWGLAYAFSSAFTIVGMGVQYRQQQHREV